jgi:hypothetical protein
MKLHRPKIMSDAFVSKNYVYIPSEGPRPRTNALKDESLEHLSKEEREESKRMYTRYKRENKKIPVVSRPAIR